MKRISIKKPTWFIDNKNGNIYWFKEIKGNKLNQAGDCDFDKCNMIRGIMEYRI